jgi:Tfp pilus assembly protein PilF
MERIGHRAAHDAARGTVRVLAGLRPCWASACYRSRASTPRARVAQGGVGAGLSGPRCRADLKGLPYLPADRARADLKVCATSPTQLSSGLVRALFLLALALVLVALAPAGTAAQDLSPALAARFNEGVAALSAGQLEQAESAFRAVIAADGDRAFVRHNLGIALQRRGRHTDALAEFRTAIRLDPTFGPSRLLAGASLLALGQPKAAVAELGRAAELMPREPAVHLQRADACERINDVVCLTDEYRALVNLAPTNPEYAYRLGKAYLRLSQWSHTRIQSIDPRAARLSQALGREYLEQGRPDLAERAFLDAIGRDASLIEVHLALATIYLGDGRLDEAGRAVGRALALEPDSKEARALQGSVDAARKPR